MPARLVALDEGSDIPLDRTMVVVGRHPQCDARLDSLRVSRHHCCMTLDNGEVVVRDLGSTNGIRINGQRVEIGRLKAGDELSIAHIRYRLDKDSPNEKTLVDGPGVRENPQAAMGNPLARPGFPLPGNGYVNGNGNSNGNSNPNVIASALPAALPANAAVNGNGSSAVRAAQADLEQPLMDALRDHLPPGMADKYRIQVIVKMDKNSDEAEAPAACQPDSSPSM